MAGRACSRPRRRRSSEPAKAVDSDLKVTYFGSATSLLPIMRCSGSVGGTFVALFSLVVRLLYSVD